MSPPAAAIDAARPAAARWAKVIDHTACIGCHACTTACKSENEVPLSVTRTYVKCVDVGVFPQTRRAFQVTRCNQCADAPCVTACPTSAMFARPDGIVDFAKSICIGCKACIAACPYDAIFINPEDQSAEKCNFCAHRIDMGLEPACVVVCPVEAILVGDLKDPGSRVAQIVQRDAVTVRRPEKDTRPKLFYKGAHQATLDPLAAARPGGGLFMWSEQHADDGRAVVSGHPGLPNSSAAALLSYDVRHEAPWGWRVSAYTWTKSVAAGLYLAPLLLALSGYLSFRNPLWVNSASIAPLLFLAITGALLIWDLKHPLRFYMIFTRPQWRSWLVRGAFIIAAFALVLLLHAYAGVVGLWGITRWSWVAGLPLAAMTAMYTGYLFAQAKARDLWQSALLPGHLLVQAVLAGAAALTGPAALVENGLVEPLLALVAGTSAIHLLFVVGEISLAHSTAHAALAVRELTRGRYAAWFWAGFAAIGFGCLAPWVGPLAAAPALIGLMAYEHAYVQAGQAVPLA
jgi:Fe-S-cluster-containing dehydrogenase component/formate-dependent nitrite reductase membrane component NrfD